MQANASVGISNRSRRVLRVVAWTVTAVTIYALSSGPVWLAAKHAGISDGSMRKVYYPLTLLGDRATRLLERYVEWCVPPNYTLGVSSECEVHRIEMTKTNVPIRYGMMGYSEWGLSLQAASTNSFPHAKDEAEGGCLVSRNSPRQALIYICPQCLGAQEHWISEHPAPQ